VGGAGDPPDAVVTPIRVLIADDQAVVRNGFRTMLEEPADIEVVAEAEDGAGAISLAARRGAEVVLMDIRMPGMDGIQATRRLAQVGGAKVLVVTTYDFDDYVFESLRAGAAGFLLKSIDPRDLVAAIRTVASGDGVVAPAVTRRLIARFAELSPAPGAAAADTLTPREHEVLLLVARGLSNGEIAEALAIEQATVKRHVGSLLTKLDLRSRAQVIVYAFQTGLITVGELQHSHTRAP
jgi:DNA-binding NarL/FixJ family response regulator